MLAQPHNQIIQRVVPENRRSAEDYARDVTEI
jgi:hypothetical protein